MKISKSVSFALIALAAFATGCRDNCERFPGAERRLLDLLTVLRSDDVCGAFRAQKSALLSDAQWMRGLEKEIGVKSSQPMPTALGSCTDRPEYRSVQEAGACVGLALQAATDALETACSPIDRDSGVAKFTEAERYVSEAIVKSASIRHNMPELCKCITASPEFPEGCTWHFYDPGTPGSRPVFSTHRGVKPELGGCGFFGNSGPAAPVTPPTGGAAN